MTTETTCTGRAATITKRAGAPETGSCTCCGRFDIDKFRLCAICLVDCKPVQFRSNASIRRETNWRASLDR